MTYRISSEVEGVVQRQTSNQQRILLITKFRFIGDTLVAIPIFRAARQHWPDAHISLLTGRNAVALLLNNPYLDEIIEFNPTGADSGTWRFLEIVKRLSRERYDISVVLNRSFHSALIPRLAGISLRAGFLSEGRALLLNRRVPYDLEKSETECYFDVLRSVEPGIHVDTHLELWVTPEERADAGRQIRDMLPEWTNDQILVGIQPGASLPEKRWAANRFAKLANSLVELDSRIRIVLTGGPDEIQSAAEMQAKCADKTLGRLVSFVGKCDLRGSLSLVSHLHLFAGADTAIMHSASALNIPTVALFGPTNPSKWGNYGPLKSVLTAPGGAMDNLSVIEVRDACQALLAKSNILQL